MTTRPLTMADIRPITPGGAKALRLRSPDVVKQKAERDADATIVHWIAAGITAREIAQQLRCAPSWRDIKTRIVLALLIEAAAPRKQEAA